MKVNSRFHAFRTAKMLAAFSFILGVSQVIGCASLPDPKYTAYSFPEQEAFVDTKPTRKYTVIGPVRVRVNYSTLNPEREEQDLCRNYYNKGVKDLVKRAKRDQQGDAVIDVRSVVYYMDGKSKMFPTPECSDDGGEGQVLLEGKAIRYAAEAVEKKSSKAKSKSKSKPVDNGP